MFRSLASQILMLLRYDVISKWLLYTDRTLRHGSCKRVAIEVSPRLYALSG
jgi:hypothetical protein